MSGTKVHWTKGEVLGMLDMLLELKSDYQSGNGWKPTVWPKVIDAVAEAKPDVEVKKDQKKCKAKLDYLKEIFDNYLFVEKFSGTGWDNEEKHAINTEEYVKEFVKEHGSQYARCFKSPCPFYTKLDELYDGLKNRATGENVISFGTKKRKSKKTVKAAATTPPTPATDKENDARAGPSNDPASDKPAAPPAEPNTRTPMANLNSPSKRNEPDDGLPGDKDADGGAYDDELRPSPPSRRQSNSKRTRADSDDDDDDDADSNNGRKRRKSGSSSTSTTTARRNAQAGSQLADSMKDLAAAVAKPLVTSADTSYVNEVVAILKDDSLLPPDPNGRLYQRVLRALSNDPAFARGFIAEDRPERRRGIIAGILEDAGIAVPDDY